MLCEHYGSTRLINYNGSEVSIVCRTYDGKFAQGINVLLSIGTTLLLLMIAEQIKPGNRFFKISALSMLALLTVYYKTFSQVRGEPYVVFFIALSIYLINEILKTTSFSYKLIIATGISLGLLVLSRQWGFFISPPFSCWFSGSSSRTAKQAGCCPILLPHHPAQCDCRRMVLCSSLFG